MGCGSLALGVMIAARDPGTAFYLSPGRAWELLAGSLCALHLRGRVPAGHDGLAWLGLALMAVPMLTYDRSVGFSGFTALAPVAGAVLVVLFAQTGTWVARLLSLRPMVGVGLISYSAYLWHQPIFAFARLRQVEAPGQGQMPALSLLALALAWASWAYVEQPFRRSEGRWLPRRRGLFGASLATIAGLLTVGVLLREGVGFPARLPPQLQRIFEASADRADNRCVMGARRDLPLHPVADCLTPDTQGQAQVLILGDSQARELAAVVGPMLGAQGLGCYATEYLGCAPLPGLLRISEAGYACDAFMRGALDYAAAAGIDTIVLIGRHGFYLHGTRFDNGEGGVEWGDTGAMDTLAGGDPRGREARLLAEYEAQIRTLARRYKVVLVNPVPEAGWDVPQTVFRRRAFAGETVALDTAYLAYQQRQGPVLQLFRRLADEIPQIALAEIDRVLCPAETGRCRNADAAGVVYHDDDHLSLTGARLVAPAIMAAITALRAGP